MDEEGRRGEEGKKEEEEGGNKICRRKKWKRSRKIKIKLSRSGGR